jgi:hypothetical protein
MDRCPGHSGVASLAGCDDHRLKGARELIMDAQLQAREALLTKVTAQADALIPDITGGPRAHEIALTLVQLAAAYAAIVGSERQ